MAHLKVLVFTVLMHIVFSVSRGYISSFESDSDSSDENDSWLPSSLSIDLLAMGVGGLFALRSTGRGVEGISSSNDIDGAGVGGGGAILARDGTEVRIIKILY